MTDLVPSPARAAARVPRSVAPLWPACEDESRVRRKLGSALPDTVDPDAITWPSYKKRKRARQMQLAFFATGVLFGVLLVFAPDVEELVSESRMWIAHELRTLKQNPTAADLALPKEFRMLARPPRKHRRSLPSVKGVPVLDVSELPAALPSP